MLDFVMNCDPAGAKSLRNINKIVFSQPLAKGRPQPQVLVPLRGPVVSGFSSQPAVTSKTQQAQERASMLTASAKGAQAFLSFGQRKPYASNAPPPLPQCPTSQARLAPVQNGQFCLLLCLKSTISEV